MFASRLFYGGLAGFARLDGRRVELTDSPELLGQRVFSIDYIPGCCFWIKHRPSSEPTDMTAAEISAADALLRALCAPTKGA